MSAAGKRRGGTGSRGKTERAGATRSPSHWVRENLEAIFVAFVLALIIRHFSVEAFKIPTGSMQPTLYGDEINGDRILVFKPSYVNSGPRRWDVMVFRYPLNSSVNYIKRCVGLPGEHLRIDRGDVYIDGKIADKPRRIQKHLWRHWPVYPRAGLDRPPEAFFRQEPEGAFVRAGGALVAETQGEAWLLFPRPITLRATAGDFPMSPAGRPGEGDAVLSDVLVSLRGELLSEGAVLMVELQSSDHVFRAEIRAGEAPRVLHGIATGGGRAGDAGPTEYSELGRADGILPRVGERYHVEFYYLDGAIHLDLDGRPRFEAPQPLGGTRWVRHPVRIGVRSGKGALSELRIFRDIYHQKSGPSTDVEIPEGHYFALGDNTTQSADSRRWRLATIRDRDGRKYRYDEEAKEIQRRGRTLVFPDVNGKIHRVEGYTLAGPPVPSPFVPRDHIVGKAFFTFFPPLRHGRFNMGLVY